MILFSWPRDAATILFFAASSALFRPAEPPWEPREPTLRLATLRVAHPTQIYAAPTPPTRDLEIAYYDAPLGKNVAYVTPVREALRKRPGMIWIHGGWDWSIGSVAWDPAERENDQSAAIFRENGFAELYPAPRGVNGNPGSSECFFGEVDDVLAAAEFLAARPDVDPERIYLGGHSTGGTLVLLAAASSRRFRGVFAFGPIDDVRNYDHGGCLPDDVSAAEAELRAPIAFLSDIVTPTFIIEGEYGHSDVLQRMRPRIGDAPVTLIEIPNADHWDVLWPATNVIASALGYFGSPEKISTVTQETISYAFELERAAREIDEEQ
jgi:pimeloyl-ACP methyl ester carboxylesterase